MGNLRIIKFTDPALICNQIKYISTRKQALKEMDGPFIVEQGQSWLFGYKGNIMVGFVCYTSNEILYCYTFPEYRNQGVLTEIYSRIPSGKYKTLANENSKNFFLNRGFKVTKKFTKWNKMQNYE